MKQDECVFSGRGSRRSFLKNGVVSGVATIGAGLLTGAAIFGKENREDERSGQLTKGDAAILRFLAAAEILETDLWQQYNELGGIQDAEVPGGTGNGPYTDGLKVLGGDKGQYIHDNTHDEYTHFDFINAYLASKRTEPSDLDKVGT